MSYSDRITRICEQAAAAFSNRDSLLSFWQDMAELYYPERATFTTDKTLGEDFASELYASDQIIFRRDFGNFFSQALRPKGRPWFTPTARQTEINEIRSVGSYLEKRAITTRSFMYDRLARFNRSMTEADHDYATFGNCVQTVERRRGGGGILYKTWHLRDCAWVENYDGEIDTMYRRFEVSVSNLARQARAQGWKLSARVQEKLEKSPQTMIKCLHVCMPLDAYDPMVKTKNRKHDWVSLYLDEDNKFEMSNKQVPAFIYIIGRWFTVTGSPYAFSPCVCASLPDVQTIQSMTWSILEAGEKAVEPPLIATHEAVLGGVNIESAGVTYVDKSYDERTGEALRALDLNLNPGVGENIRMAIRSNMMEAWYTNRLFLPPTGAQPRTAQEIARINEDFLRTVQPIIEPAENERNGNVLDPTMELLIREGHWGPLEAMPKELRGRDVDFTYDNPIEDIRKGMVVQSWQQGAEVTAQARELLGPASTAAWNGEKAYRDTITAISPPDWVFDEEEARKRAEEAAAEMETQGAVEEVAQVGAVAEQFGKAKQAFEKAPQQAMAA